MIKIGQSGLGKSTFINTLFYCNLLESGTKKDHDIVDKTTEIAHHKFELNEGAVNLILTLIDTPGFGDQINREEALYPIVDYIDAQYEKYRELENDATVRMADIPDTRVHSVLYFISPNCHQLKEIDLVFLKELSTRCNVIPIIGKSDTLTLEERQSLKQKISKQLRNFDIKVYPSAYCQDGEFSDRYSTAIPFCVVGANAITTNSDGADTRLRRYQWGDVEIENQEHSDFVSLREMLMVNNLVDLMTTTHIIHYAGHRQRKIRVKGRPVSVLKSDSEFEIKLEKAHQAMLDSIAQKEEELRARFQEKMKEQDEKFKEVEERLSQKDKELLAELSVVKKKLDEDERELELNIQRTAAIKKTRSFF